MAATIGLRGTKILKVTDNTLRIQMSVPKGTHTSQHLCVLATDARLQFLVLTTRWTAVEDTNLC